MSRYTGNLESITPVGGVSGWVVDTDEPSSAAHLAVLLDGQTVTTVVCSGNRPDVRAAGYRTMAAGFFFTIPHHFRDGVERKLSFLPVRGGEPFELGGPTTVQLAPAPVGEMALVREKSVLTGWVAPSRNPQRPVLLEVLVDERPLRVVSLRADPKSPDPDRIPFSIPLPADVIDDPASRKIEARILDTGVYLSGGPIASRASKLIGNFELLRGRRINGWAYDIGLSVAPKLDVYCDGRFLMQIACDGYRKDLFKHHGATSGAFNTVLPLDAFGSKPQFIYVRLPDGTELDGGPKRIDQVDIDLAQLEAAIIGGIGALDVAPAARDAQIASVINMLGKIMTVSAGDISKKDYRQDAVQLGQEFISQVCFACDTEASFKAMRSLALLGISVARNGDDFRRAATVLLSLDENASDLYGVIDLERQRRHPMHKLLLAAVLLAQDNEEAGIDLIFDSFRNAKSTEQAMIANLGTSMMMRAGHSAEAQSLMVASLIK